MAKRIEIVVLESGVRAVAELYEKEAPKTCEAMWKCLEVPMETEGAHAMTVGRELFFVMPPENMRVEAEEIPTLENCTRYPVTGDLMFCRFTPHLVREPFHVLPEEIPWWDFIVMYGPDTMTTGALVTVWGHIVEGLDELASEAAKIRTEGTKLFRVSRLEE